MSVSLWAYNEAVCDGDFCPGNCDICQKRGAAQEKNEEEEENGCE